MTDLERILTTSYKARMVTYLRTHPKAFLEAIRLTLIDNPPFSWRASWALWSSMEYNDTRLRKHVPALVDLIETVKPNQKREIMMILQRMEVRADLEGKLFDTCVNLWLDPGMQGSVRYNALRIMVNLVHKHPELKNEVLALLSDQYTHTLSSGVKHSVHKIILSLKS